MLATLLSQMGSGAAPTADGAEPSEDELSSLLLTMMQSLTNKNILYEPLSELHAKFPAWLEKHAADTKEEDVKRYREQQRLVGEMVGKFEEKGYKDENVPDREFIVERMQKMQEMGSPPEELVGGLEGGLAGLDALGAAGGEEGCAQQ
jgi:peroxin-19